MEDYGFPADILNAQTLARTLAPERVAALRRELETGGGERIQYAAPWYESGEIDRHCVGWVFSQAVLEHVDDLDGAYGAFTAWLAPDGVMSHQIDFKCHNMAVEWNGHWAAPDWLWRIVRGRRPYLLNREPVSTHFRMMARHGFEVVDMERVPRSDGIAPDRLPRRYQDLPGEDLTTAGAFIVSRLRSSQ